MKQLKPGDLVRCYGNPKFDLISPTVKGEKATVAWADDSGVGVHFIHRSVAYVFHRKQVRLLKKKENHKAREIWLAEVMAWNVPGLYSHFETTEQGILDIVDSDRLIRTIKFREVLPTTKVKPITKDQIRKAWHNVASYDCTKGALECFIDSLEKEIGRKIK